MIKLSTLVIKLPQADGSCELLNADQLRDDLWQSCLAVGHTDPDVADDLVAVIEHFIHERQREEAALNARDIDGLVVRVLVDIGLEHIAACFCERRDLSSIAMSGKLVTPSANVIAELLQDDVFFVAKPIDQISDRVAQVTAEMDFHTTTSRFVVELAKCLWIQDSYLDTPTADDHNDYWTIRRGEFATLLDPADTEWAVDGIVGMRSISALFPMITLEVNLLRLAHRLGNSILVELQFYPEFDLLCQALARAIHSVRETVKKRSLKLHDGPMRVSIKIRKFTPLAVEKLELSPVGVTAMQAELTNIIHWRLGDIRCEFES